MRFTPEIIQKMIEEFLSDPAPSPPEPSMAVPVEKRNDDVEALLRIPNDEEFLREAYRTILGRPPDLQGAVHYATLLRNQVPRRMVLSQLVHSEEARSKGKRSIGTKIEALRPKLTHRLREFIYRNTIMRARRLAEVLLQVRRIQLLEGKVDCLLREVEVRSDRLSAKTDSALWTLSEKLDLYFASVLREREAASRKEEQLADQIDSLSALVSSLAQKQQWLSDYFERQADHQTSSVEKLFRIVTAHATTSRGEALALRQHVDGMLSDLRTEISLSGTKQRRVLQGEIMMALLRMQSLSFAQERRRERDSESRQVSLESRLASLECRLTELAGIIVSLQVNGGVTEKRLMSLGDAVDELMGAHRSLTAQCLSKSEFDAAIGGIEDQLKDNRRALTATADTLRRNQLEDLQVLQDAVHDLAASHIAPLTSRVATRDDLRESTSATHALVDHSWTQLSEQIKLVAQTITQGIEQRTSAIDGLRTLVEGCQAQANQRIGEVQGCLAQLAQHLVSQDQMKELIGAELVRLTDEIMLPIRRTVATLNSLWDVPAEVREEVKSSLESVRDSMERLRNSIRPAVIGGGEDVLVTEVDQLIVAVPGKEWRMAAYLAFRGVPEPGMMGLFRRSVKRGMVVVDVGANIGLYTLNGARLVGEEGAVYAFEPTPRVFRILRDNVQVNGFLEPGHVKLYQLAVWDSEGNLPLTIHADNSGHNTLFPDTSVRETVVVPTAALDSIVGTGVRVDVVKIDAEGAEPWILRGMREIIDRSPSIQIFLEFAPSHLKRAGLEPEAFLSELGRSGFEVKLIDDMSGETKPIDTEQLCSCFSSNLYLTRPGRGGSM